MNSKSVRCSRIVAGDACCQGDTERSLAALEEMCYER